jgi:hypothetical protein
VPTEPSPLPEPVESLAAVAPSPAAQPRRATPTQRILRGVGVGLGVASLVSYGGAFSTRNQYDGAVYEGDVDRIRALHGLTNGLTIGAVAGGSLSLTLLVTGFL